MFGVALPEALVRVLILAVPAFVLAALVLLAVTGRAKRRFDTSASKNPEISPAPLLAPNVAAGSIEGENREMGMTQALRRVEETDVIDGLETRIRSAEANGESSGLATLYLELGRAHLKHGRTKDALEALRSAAGVGALHGPKSVHAEARMDLAEYALNSGDPISACEHWQIARMVLHEDGQRTAASKVDALMRANGCPTDWVLTDF